MTSELAKKAEVFVDTELDLVVITATTQRAPIVGRAIASFDHNNHRQSLDINVAKELSSPLILGMDGMKSMGLVIDSDRNEVRYWDEKSDQLLCLDRTRISAALEFRTNREEDNGKVVPERKDLSTEEKSPTKQLSEEGNDRDEEISVNIMTSNEPMSGRTEYSAIDEELVDRSQVATDGMSSESIEEEVFINSIDVLNCQQKRNTFEENVLFEDLFCLDIENTNEEKADNSSREDKKGWAETPVDSIDNTSAEEQEKQKFLLKFEKDLKNVPKRKLKEVKDMLWKFREAFSAHDFDIGTCTKKVINIPTTEGLMAKRFPYYRYSPKSQQIINDWAQEMKKVGIVTESNSPIAHPIVLVMKDGKEPRITIDYTYLNKHIITSDYPYISIKEAMEALSGAKYYSSIDIKNAFYSVLIAPEDRWKTAFRTHRELLELTRLPMGLKLSPKAMQQLIDEMIAKYKYSFLIAYIDDIMCFSQTFDEHIEHVEILLELIIEYGLKINIKNANSFDKK